MQLIPEEFLKEFTKQVSRFTFDFICSAGAQVQIWWTGKRDCRTYVKRLAPVNPPEWFGEMLRLYERGANTQLRELLSAHEEEILTLPAAAGCRAKNIFADVKMHFGDLEDAARYLRSAWADALNAGDIETQTYICSNISVLRMEQNRFAGARRWLNRAPMKSAEWTLYNLLAVASLEQDMRACLIAAYDLLKHYPSYGSAKSILLKDTSMSFAIENDILNCVKPLAKRPTKRRSNRAQVTAVLLAIGLSCLFASSTYAGMKVGGAAGLAAR